mgnify:CR=1 FL=1
MPTAKQDKTRKNGLTVEFLLDPAVQGFHNWVICGSPPSRHRAKYVIIMVGLAKSL